MILNVNDGKVVVSWRDLLSRLFDGPDWAVEGGDSHQVLVRWSLLARLVPRFHAKPALGSLSLQARKSLVSRHSS